MTLLREMIFQQESPLVDTDAANKAADADAALQELGSDTVAVGYVTATVVVVVRCRPRRRMRNAKPSSGSSRAADLSRLPRP